MFDEYWRLQWEIAVADDRERDLLARQDDLRRAMDDAEGLPL